MILALIIKRRYYLDARIAFTCISIKMEIFSYNLKILQCTMQCTVYITKFFPFTYTESLFSFYFEFEFSKVKSGFSKTSPDSVSDLSPGVSRVWIFFESGPAFEGFRN